MISFEELISNDVKIPVTYAYSSDFRRTLEIIVNTKSFEESKFISILSLGNYRVAGAAGGAIRKDTTIQSDLMSPIAAIMHGNMDNTLVCIMLSKELCTGNSGISTMTTLLKSYYDKAVHLLNSNAATGSNLVSTPGDVGRAMGVEERQINRTSSIPPRLVIISNSSDMPDALSGMAFNIGCIDEHTEGKKDPAKAGLNFSESEYITAILDKLNPSKSDKWKMISDTRKGIFAGNNVVQDVEFAEDPSNIGGYEKVKDHVMVIRDYIKNEKADTLKIKGSLFVGPAGTGKCVDSNSILWYNGGIKRMKNMRDHVSSFGGTSMKITKPIEIIAKENDHFVTASVTHLIKNKETKGFKIQLEHGYQIKTSKWHPIYASIASQMGWVKSSVIQDKINKQVDIWVPIKVGHDFFNKNEYHNIALKYKQIIKGGNKPIYENVEYNLTINESIGYILGVLIGDGSLHNCKNNHCFGFTSADTEIVNELERTINKVNGTMKSVKNTKYAFTINSYVISALVKYSGNACTAYTKGIPDFIIESPKTVLSSFIKGLFDTDGTAAKRNGYPSFTSTSEELARDVHNILLVFGIKANLNYKPNAFKGAWTVDITSDSQLFYAKIGFIVTRKQDRKRNLPIKVNTNWKVMPNQISSDMKNIIEQTYNITPRMGSNKVPTNLLKKYNSTYKYWEDYITGKRCPSNDKVKEFISIFNCEDIFSKYMVDNVIWAKVTSVTECKVDLLDLTVPGKSCFIANGLINHNSKLLTAIPRMIGLPGFQLDVNAALGQFQGQSESKLKDALSRAKKLAPCVLCIDEIEKMLAGTGEGEVAGNEVAAKLLGIILTAMAERNNIYWVASANKISHLPAPLLRKGRFDHLWYVPLPDPSNRAKILGIHCKLNNVDIEKLDVNKIVAAMDQFTGAEIEHCVKEGAIEEIAGRCKSISTDIILKHIKLVKPIAKTKEKELAELDSWAKGNTIPVD